MIYTIIIISLLLLFYIENQENYKKQINNIVYIEDNKSIIIKNISCPIFNDYIILCENNIFFKTYLNTNDNVSCKLKNNMTICIINNFPIEIIIENKFDKNIKIHIKCYPNLKNKLITLIIITVLISNFFLLQ